MFNAMLMRSRNKKGFTLMEMLIVVAIIAILVAVSFPVFTAQLEKAKTATDDANMRAAKAVALSTYLTADPVADITVTYFNADKGELDTAGKDIKVYGQSSNGSPAPAGKIIQVTVTSGVFEGTWVTKPTA